ncbi:MAG: hypothetical protein AAFP69_22485, partial [Planctomycetota bacterium]
MHGYRKHRFNIPYGSHSHATGVILRVLFVGLLVALVPCAPVVASPFPQIASLFSAEQQRPADTTTWDTPLSDPPSSPILRSNSLPPGQSFRQDNASAQSTDANGLIRRQIRIQWDSQQQIPLKASIRIRKKSTAQNIAVLDDTPRTGDAPTITLTLDQVVNLCMHPQSASAIEVENDGGSDQDEGLILLRQPDALHQNGGVQFQLTLRHRGSGEKPSAAEIRDWLANHQVLVSVADRPAVQRGLLEVVSTDDNAAAVPPLVASEGLRVWIRPNRGDALRMWLRDSSGRELSNGIVDAGTMVQLLAQRAGWIGQPNETYSLTCTLTGRRGTQLSEPASTQYRLSQTFQTDASGLPPQTIQCGTLEIPPSDAAYRLDCRLQPSSDAPSFLQRTFLPRGIRSRSKATRQWQADFLAIDRTEDSSAEEVTAEIIQVIRPQNTSSIKSIQNSVSKQLTRLGQHL